MSIPDGLGHCHSLQGECRGLCCLRPVSRLRSPLPFGHPDWWLSPHQRGTWDWTSHPAGARGARSAALLGSFLTCARLGAGRSLLLSPLGDVGLADGRAGSGPGGWFYSWIRAPRILRLSEFRMCIGSRWKVESKFKGLLQPAVSDVRGGAGLLEAMSRRGFWSWRDRPFCVELVAAF